MSGVFEKIWETITARDVVYVLAMIGTVLYNQHITQITQDLKYQRDHDTLLALKREVGNMSDTFGSSLQQIQAVMYSNRLMDPPSPMTIPMINNVEIGKP